MYKRLAFYLVTIAAIVVVYLKFSELRLIQQFFRQSNGLYLGIVILIQLVFYLAQALNYRVILQIKGLIVGVRELLPVGIVVQFISQALPTAGLSGQVLFVSYLKKYGLTVAEGIGRAILEVTTLYATHAVFFAISVILLFRDDVFQREPRFWFFVYAFLGFATLFAMLVFLSQKRRRDTRINWLIEHVDSLLKRWLKFSNHFETIKEQFRETLGAHVIRRHVGLFTWACFWHGVMLLTHIATLYVVGVSIGYKIPLAACFVAFTFSKFLSMVSIVPGAPGVFEGAMVLILLSFGVDKSVALAATLLTRAFTFWLPMPIGWVLYGRYMKKFEAVVS